MVAAATSIARVSAGTGSRTPAARAATTVAKTASPAPIVSTISPSARAIGTATRSPRRTKAAPSGPVVSSTACAPASRTRAVAAASPVAKISSASSAPSFTSAAPAERSRSPAAKAARSRRRPGRGLASMANRAPSTTRARSIATSTETSNGNPLTTTRSARAAACRSSPVGTRVREREASEKEYCGSPAVRSEIALPVPSGAVVASRVTPWSAACRRSIPPDSSSPTIPARTAGTSSTASPTATLSADPPATSTDPAGVRSSSTRMSPSTSTEAVIL